jgi:KUP system potassium uptake protein
VLPLIGGFLLMDGSFLAGNVVKLFSGAWVPIAFGLVIFGMFWIWTVARNRYHASLEEGAMSLPDFTREAVKWNVFNQGTAIFLSTHDSIPLVGKNQWLRENCKYEQVLLVTIIEKQLPTVSGDEAVRLEQICKGVWKVTATFGFMQHPDINEVLKSLSSDQIKLDWSRLAFFLPEPTFAKKPNFGKQLLQETYCFLLRNSLTSAEYFRVPPLSAIHVSILVTV